MPTQMFPRLPDHATFVADTNFVSGTQKNVSGFVQKQFLSATNVSQFAQAKKHHGQQRVLVHQGLFVDETMLNDLITARSAKIGSWEEQPTILLTVVKNAFVG